MMKVAAKQWGIVGGLILGVVGHLQAATHALIIVGLSGDQAMATRYQKEVDGWQDILARAGVQKENLTIIDGAAKTEAKAEAEVPATNPTNVRTQVLSALERYTTQLTTQDDLLLVLIGYGATRNEDYVFQNRGPRLTGPDFADKLKACLARSLTVFHTGPGGTTLALQLADPRTVIITATAGAGEINESQWGLLFVERAMLEQADNKEEKPASKPLLSLLKETDEAVADFYKKAQLARTEHAQLFLGTHKPIEAPFELDIPEPRLANWSFARLDAGVVSSDSPPTATRPVSTTQSGRTEP